ncbi:hypothetical protein AMK13_27195 [Streptomyces sp. CB02056]|nr:hypothetical protein AMK13_27195 [Streptomyces sp. CB02056]
MSFLVVSVGSGQAAGSASGKRGPRFGGPALRVVDVGGLRQSQDAVRAQAADDLDGQVPQHVREAHRVVARVHHDHDVRVAVAPLTRGDQAPDHLPQLGGGHQRSIVGRAEADHVQDLRPRGPVRGERGDERVGPARHHVVGRLASAAVDQADQPLGRAGGVGAQPRRDVHGEHDPAREAGQWQLGQQVPRQLGVQTAVVERAVQGAVAAAVLGGQ